MNKIILIGNKNVGKTTFYNTITKQNEKIANVSGSTVEIKSYQKGNYEIVDLPGIDNFNPCSKDEEIVIDYLSKHKNDQINLVLDATNIIKSSNLLVETLELNRNVNLYLHQSDQIKNSHNLLNSFKHETNLNAFLTTHKDSNTIIKNWNVPAQQNNNFKLDYGFTIENLITELIQFIPLNEVYNQRFIAIQLLLENDYFYKFIPLSNKLQILNLIINAKEKASIKINRSIIIARKIYVEKILKSTNIIQPKDNKIQTFLDQIFLNKFSGPLIFISIVALIYYISIEIIGIPLQNLWVDHLENLGTHLTLFFEQNNINPIVISLFNEVIIGSLGTIIGFIPMILSIYFFNSALETTGYNYRTSILFDNLLERFGMEGRSVVAIMSGYGCNVPAILATRIIKSKAKRIISILIMPLIPCVARLPLISLFATLFFKKWHFAFVLLFNLMILIIVLIASWILKNTKFKNTKQTLVLEFPKLKTPNIWYLLKLSWNISFNYISKIFTTLFLGAIFVWILTKFGIDGFNSQNPFINNLIFLTSWVFKPFNLHSDKFSALLIVGFSVKELLISTIPILFNNDINHVLTSNLNIAQAFAILTFFILYTPCLSTYLTIKKEIGRNYANFSIIFSLILTYIISYLLYIIISLFT